MHFKKKIVKLNCPLYHTEKGRERDYNTLYEKRWTERGMNVVQRAVIELEIYSRL